MENPFKKILHNEEVPKLLKDKVMNDISFIKLSIDVADLFVIKYPATIASVLALNDKKHKPKK
jgi:hypothetical protein